MTGPDHYREAERVVAPRDTPSLSGREMRQVQPTMETILQAQVHATLALAAAVALQDRAPDKRAWDEVGEPTPSLGRVRVVLPGGGTDG